MDKSKENIIDLMIEIMQEHETISLNDEWSLKESSYKKVAEEIYEEFKHEFTKD